jgi:hypothetical protein
MGMPGVQMDIGAAMVFFEVPNIENTEVMRKCPISI